MRRRPRRCTRNCWRRSAWIGRTRAEEIAERSSRATTPRRPISTRRDSRWRKMKLDRSQPEEAVKYLEQVVKDSDSAEIADIARLRLGARARAAGEVRRCSQGTGRAEGFRLRAAIPRSARRRLLRHGRVRMRRAPSTRRLSRRDQSGAGDQAFLQAKLAELAGGAAAGAMAEPAAPAGGQLAPPAVTEQRPDAVHGIEARAWRRWP